MAATVASPNNPINVPAPPTGDVYDAQKRTTTRVVDGVTQVDSWDGGRTETRDSTVLGSTDANGKYTAGSGAPDTGGYGTPYDAPTAGAPAPAAGAPASCNGCGAPPAATTPPAAGAPATTAPAPDAAAAPKTTPAPAKTVDEKIADADERVKNWSPAEVQKRVDDLANNGKTTVKGWVAAKTDEVAKTRVAAEAAVVYQTKIKDAKVSGDTTEADTYKKDVLDPAVAAQKAACDATTATVKAASGDTTTTDASAPKADAADPASTATVDAATTKAAEDDVTASAKAVKNGDDALKKNPKASEQWVTDRKKANDDAAAYSDAAVAYRDKLKEAKTPEDVRDAKNYKETVLDPAKSSFLRSGKVVNDAKPMSPEVTRVEEKKAKVNQYLKNINDKINALEAVKTGSFEDRSQYLYDKLWVAKAAGDEAIKDLDAAEKLYLSGDKADGKNREKIADKRIWDGNETAMRGASHDINDLIEASGDVVFGGDKAPARKGDEPFDTYGTAPAKDSGKK
jgi:hypothetical protein